MYYAVVFVAGLAIGSFLNVCIYRIPRKISIVAPSSRCPSCGTQIRAIDNVPVLSFLFLLGRCRNCGARIPRRYPAVELLGGFLFAFAYAKFGLSFELFFYYAFLCALVVIAFIDLEFRIIPDVVSIPFILIGLVFSLFPGLHAPTFSESSYSSPYLRLLSSFLGIGIGAGSLTLVAYIYFKTTGVEGMGGGDVKLTAMIGAFLGWKATLGVIFLASLAGSVLGIVLMLVFRMGRRTPIPFGSFLAPSAMLLLFFWARLVEWYLIHIRVG